MNINLQTQIKKTHYLALELSNEEWFDEFNGNYANKADCFIKAYGNYPEVLILFLTIT